MSYEHGGLRTRPPAGHTEARRPRAPDDPRLPDRSADPRARLNVGAGLPYRGFTANEYHAMGAASILHPDERTEFIDGQIVPMSPVSGPHIFTVQRLSASSSDN